MSGSDRVELDERRAAGPKVKAGSRAERAERVLQSQARKRLARYRMPVALRDEFTGGCELFDSL